jgi:hypothetical protein
MENFLFKTKNINEIRTILTKLNDLGYLGAEIHFGTSCDISECTYDVIQKLQDNDEGNRFLRNNEIAGISISDSESDYLMEKFDYIFGKNGILVGLTTDFDIKAGDIAKTQTSSLMKCFSLIDKIK